MESIFFCYRLDSCSLLMMMKALAGTRGVCMLVSDEDDTGTGTGTGTGSRRCGAPLQLSAWLAKGLAIPEVGIMQCLERRKAQEKKKRSTSSLLLLHTCRMHVLPSKSLAYQPTSQYCDYGNRPRLRGYLHVLYVYGLPTVRASRSLTTAWVDII